MLPLAAGIYTIASLYVMTTKIVLLFIHVARDMVRRMLNIKPQFVLGVSCMLVLYAIKMAVYSWMLLLLKRPSNSKLIFIIIFKTVLFYNF